MKIFISWSGKHSLGVASALREWLPYIFTDIDLFVSSEDIRKGKRWPLEVSKELDVSNFGIVCLTPDNLDAPWLLFEAGALSKSVKEASVYTLLVGGIRMSDVEGPLSHFQHTVFEKEDFFKLIKSINDAHEQRKQDPQRLRKVFDKFWDDLEAAVSKQAKSETKPEKKRSVEEMLHELLETTGYIARNFSPPENKPISLQTLLESLPPTLPPKENSTWEAIKDAVGRASPFVRSYILEAFGNYSDGRLTILFPHNCADHLPLFDNAKNRKLLQAIMSDMGLGDKCEIFIGVAPESSLPSLKPFSPPPRRPPIK